MSPTIFATGHLKIKIHRRDHNPPHVHVEGPGGINARFDLSTLALLDDTDFSARDLKMIQDYLNANQLKLIEVWNDFHK